MLKSVTFITLQHPLFTLFRSAKILLSRWYGITISIFSQGV